MASCFDTIDHKVLLTELANFIGDTDVMRLLEQILHAGGSHTRHLWWQRRHGIVQGSSLSPLLCNLYLHKLDVALSDLGQATDKGLIMLRYADDLLLLARDAKLAERGIALIRQVLKRSHQQLGTNTIATPIQMGINWLGVRLQPRPLMGQDRLTFGYVIPEPKVLDMLHRVNEMTEPPSDKIDTSAFNPARWIVSINHQLRDWRQVYLYADNSHEVFRVLDDHTRYRVGQLLQSITGNRWPQVKQQYRAKLARGFWTWEVPGARLSVLSSLAPHAPFGLIRQPAWLKMAKSMASRAVKQITVDVPTEELPALPPGKEVAK